MNSKEEEEEIGRGVNIKDIGNRHLARKDFVKFNLLIAKERRKSEREKESLALTVLQTSSSSSSSLF